MIGFLRSLKDCFSKLLKLFLPRQCLCSAYVIAGNQIIAFPGDKLYVGKLLRFLADYIRL